MALTDGQKVMAGYWEGVNPNDNEIETNKEVTIDTATYKNAVAIKPTGDYDAMKKVTVTVVSALYAWKNDTAIIYTRTSEPKTADKALIGASTGISESSISAVADEFASITVSATVYTRYEDGDVEVC